MIYRMRLAVSNLAIRFAHWIDPSEPMSAATTSAIPQAPFPFSDANYEAMLFGFQVFTSKHVPKDKGILINSKGQLAGVLDFIDEFGSAR